MFFFLLKRNFKLNRNQPFLIRPSYLIMKAFYSERKNLAEKDKEIKKKGRNRLLLC